MGRLVDSSGGSGMLCVQNSVQALELAFVERRNGPKAGGCSCTRATACQDSRPRKDQRGMHFSGSVRLAWHWASGWSSGEVHSTIANFKLGREVEELCILTYIAER